jgi:glycosyltransferase involved in cell wall biosynthesis
MRRFARAGNKVMFVNSITMGLPSIRHPDLFPRIARKLRSYARYARRTEEGIVVVSPPTLPFFGNRAVRAINRFLLLAQLRRLVRRASMTNPILWIAIPTAVDMVGRLGESLVIYQVSDKYDEATMDFGTNPAAIRRLHERAIAAADLVLYSGRKLFDEAQIGAERSHLLEQAVDFDHFARAGFTEDVAPEVAAIPGPRIGYFGGLDPWLIDQDLLRLAAQERPEWHWVLIGNAARGFEVEDIPTVHFLPRVDYEDLPRYAAGFDVCVLPWDVDHSWTSYGSAIKVREYLATGKPVVISPLAEYEPMSDVLRIARSQEDFIRLIDDALAETDPSKRASRQAAVRSGTWDARAESVSRLIEEQLNRRGAA